MTKRIPTQELISELERLADLLGYPPSFEDVRKHSKFSPHPFQDRFGSWENVKRAIGWEPAWESYDPFSVSPVDGAWLSGLIDGEGCFRIARPSPKSGGGLSHSYAPVFCMSVRDDDKPMIDEMIRILGLGAVSIHIDDRAACIRKGMPGANPAAKINLRDVPSLAYHLIPLLKVYPLRSKKKFELVVFDFAVNVLLEKRLSGRLNCRYTDEERQTMDNCYLALRDLKKYETTPQGVVDKYVLPIKF